MVEELECDICMEDLIDSKPLPCGHSLCKKCKEDLLQFNDDGSAILKCPNQCEEDTKIGKNETIDDVLRKNFTVERLLTLHHKNMNAQANRKNIKCQGEHAHEALPFCYCKHCRKFLCRTCLDEHACERNGQIKISYDTRKQCFLPICEDHKLLAKFICNQCNNTFLCIYCENRTHKNHQLTELNSGIQKLKAQLNSELEKAKKVTEKIKQTEDFVLKKLHNFREKLVEELLLRKYINLSLYFAQLNDEESNILNEFDEEVKEFVAQRKRMLNSCDEVKKFLKDREETSTLLMMTEQNILLERLQAISNELSLKVVLHDRTNENSLGKLQIEKRTDNCKVKSTLSDSNDRVVQCKILSEQVDELLLKTNSSDFWEFINDIERKFSFSYSCDDTEWKSHHKIAAFVKDFTHWTRKQTSPTYSCH